jgi:ankyrin repeat protein
MSSHPAPTRALPNKPSLAQLRKQAKELLHSYRVGKDAAVGEVEHFERSPDPARFVLADAQRVLARAYGFPSWASLKLHVEGVNFEAFLAAVEAGDVAAVKRLAAAHPNLINPRHAEFRDSALHRAVLHRNQELTHVLMQLGANARVGIWPHRDSTSAYAIAVDREYSEIVAIIEREEDARRVRLSHEGTLTCPAVDALLQAIAEGCIADAISLMEAGPELIGACDRYGVTPLHVAAWKHDPAMVGWLLDHGASPGARALRAALRCDEPAESDKTPLDFAAIVAGWAPEGRDRNFYFIENARVDPARFHETARLLLQSGAELTPRGAVSLGDCEAVLRLHHDGRLTNEIQVYRGGLLAIAVRVNRRDMVTTLLDLGLDPDETVVTDDGARSSGMPLWFASMCGRQEIAELLLAHGADANAIVYACGDSLSHCTAEDEKMAALLRKHGAGLTVEQLPDGEQGRETAKAILAGTMPASSLNVSNPTRTDLAEQMLCATGDVEIVRLCLSYITRPRNDPWWNYVLIYSDEVDKLQLILDHGVDPDVIGDGGFTMLHHLGTNYDGQSHRVTRATMLLDAGASLSRRDPLLKSTPLGWACRWGQMDLVQLYVQRGADVRERDAEVWATPLAWAIKGGHHEIVQQLQSRGAGS